MSIGVFITQRNLVISRQKNLIDELQGLIDKSHKIVKVTIL